MKTLQLSKQRDLIFVDSFSAMGRTDWLLNSTDYVHLNDLGHSFPFLGNKVLEAIERNVITIDNTGGTDNCQEIESIWQAAKNEFEV